MRGKTALPVPAHTTSKRVPLPTGKGYRYGGRQKGSANVRFTEIRNVAQIYGPEALAKAVEIMRHAMRQLEDGTLVPDFELQLKAATEIMNRAYGKPHQAVAVGVGALPSLDAATLTDAQLGTFIARLELAAGAEGEAHDSAPEGGASPEAESRAVAPRHTDETG
jgi:hypothetical protein